MNTNTPQQLGRTETALDDHGCDDSSFCLNCFKADLLLEDFRGELAFLAVVRMKNLVAIRVAQDGVSDQDAWSWILSGARTVACLISLRSVTLRSTTPRRATSSRSTHRSGSKSTTASTSS